MFASVYYLSYILYIWHILISLLSYKYLVICTLIYLAHWFVSKCHSSCHLPPTPPPPVCRAKPLGFVFLAMPYLEPISRTGYTRFYRYAMELWQNHYRSTLLNEREYVVIRNLKKKNTHCRVPMCQVPQQLTNTTCKSILKIFMKEQRNE